jgi:homoserine kinase type II
LEKWNSEGKKHMTPPEKSAQGRATKPDTRHVWLLQHLHVLPGEAEDVKTIGIYSSREAALAAVARLKTQPGFRDFPHVVNPDAASAPDGFYIDKYLVDQDNWSDSYVTA